MGGQRSDLERARILDRIKHLLEIICASSPRSIRFRSELQSSLSPQRGVQFDLSLQQVFNIAHVNVQELLDPQTVLNPLNLQNAQRCTYLRRRRASADVRPKRDLRLRPTLILGRVLHPKRLRLDAHLALFEVDALCDVRHRLNAAPTPDGRCPSRAPLLRGTRVRSAQRHHSARRRLHAREPAALRRPVRGLRRSRLVGRRPSNARGADSTASGSSPCLDLLTRSSSPREMWDLPG